MSEWVVDASVIAAVMFQEQYCEPAQKWLATDAAFHAPELIYAELASVIWKRQQRGEITAEEMEQLTVELLALPLSITPSAALIRPALSIASRTGRSVYDCLYLGLAVERDSIMMTLDQRLVNALVDDILNRHVQWVGDFSVGP